MVIELFCCWINIVECLSRKCGCISLSTTYEQFQNVYTVYPKKYAHGFAVLCFVVVMQSFIMNSHEAFTHIHQGCFAGTGAIVRLPQCQWSKPDGYSKISQCITTTKHNKAKTVCIFLGIDCKSVDNLRAISKCIYHQKSFALFLKITWNMKFHQLMAFFIVK